MASLNVDTAALNAAASDFIRMNSLSAIGSLLLLPFGICFQSYPFITMLLAIIFVNANFILIIALMQLYDVCTSIIP